MFKWVFKAVLAAFLFNITTPVFSQTVPGATEGIWPLVVGIGYSNFRSDWSGRLGGPSFWVDWTFNGLPGKLSGLGLEVDGRDLNFNRSSGGDPRLRMDTAGGGPIYTWRRSRRIRPYAKFLMGLGSIDFTLPNYFHDTRTVYSAGGGVDYRFLGHFMIRGDYEYQIWPRFINLHAMNPQGFTIGVDYDFERPRRFQNASTRGTHQSPTDFSSR